MLREVRERGVISREVSLLEFSRRVFTEASRISSGTFLKLLWDRSSRDNVTPDFGKDLTLLWLM